MQSERCTGKTPTMPRKQMATPTPGLGNKMRRFAAPWLLVASLMFFVALGFGWYEADQHWPYRYRNVEPLLQNIFASQVKIDNYHRTYFPRPGFVATGLTLRRKSTDPNSPPLGTAEHLIVQGGWLDLLMLRSRVELVDVVGMHVSIPAEGSAERARDFPPGSTSDFAGPETLIEKLQLHNALLEIQRQDAPPLRFPIQKLVVRNVQKGGTASYTLDMTNPIPTGHILAHGTFGPLRPTNLGDTPLSGEFTFDQVQLNTIGSLKGVLSSSGHFDNTLASIDAKASLDTPRFSVATGRPIHVKSDVHCTIDGLNGDVILDDVALTMGATPVHIRGSVAGKPTMTNVTLDIPKGRVQDLLTPFDHSPSPIVGGVALHAKAKLLPAAKGSTFFQRLRMEGTFDVPADKLTSHAQEQSLSSFSERAQGTKSTKDDSPPDVDVLSSLSGAATVSNGVASMQNLRFAVAGASIDFRGTYSLQSSKVDMTGTLRMDTDISHTTTGFKSILLKPLAPFFARKHAGAVVPVAVTGTSGNYKIGQNLLPR